MQVHYGGTGGMTITSVGAEITRAVPAKVLPVADAEHNDLLLCVINQSRSDWPIIQAPRSL
jgi:hypothetical protein